MSAPRDLYSEYIKRYFRFVTIGTDFNIVIDRSTGYFNASQLCVDMGKDFQQWYRLRHIQELVKYHKAQKGESYRELGLMMNIRRDDKIGGTYIPWELLLSLATWISPDFYFKCANIIFAEENEHMKQVEDSEHMSQVEEHMQKLRMQNEKPQEHEIGQLEPLRDMKAKYYPLENNSIVDIIADDRDPIFEDTVLRERLVIFKTGSEYEVIRGEDVYCKERLDNNVDRNRTAVTIDFEYHPESMNIFIRLNTYVLLTEILQFQYIRKLYCPSLNT